jgi:hypothetical protein
MKQHRQSASCDSASPQTRTVHAHMRTRIAQVRARSSLRVAHYLNLHAYNSTLHTRAHAQFPRGAEDQPARVCRVAGWQGDALDEVA